MGVNPENDKFLFRGWDVDDVSMEYSGPSRPLLFNFVRTKTQHDSRKLKAYADVVSRPPIPSLDLSASIPACPMLLHYLIAIVRCLSRSTSKVFDACV